MANRGVRPEGLALPGGRAMRSPSISSDMQSVSARSTATAAPTVNPQPVYVASSGAAQLVSSEYDTSVSVSDAALVLLNDFLDQILYNLLSSAHSVDLGRLKATVPIVLKPRLGKAALEAADDELREYLEDSDDESQSITNATFDPKSGFNLELAWKLARLRCMVYTRLGDLEEEDEEEYIEQEELHEQDTGATQSVHLGPASAIFLTSVLEYLGEQALFYAAQNAQRRSHAGRALDQSSRLESPRADGSETMVLDEVDMFSVGRESPLSRLWRSWRRNMRLTREPSSRPLSPERLVSPNTDNPSFGTRKENFGTPIGIINEQHQSLAAVLETKSPSQVPLPISDRDVDEIEVPGLAREIDDEDDGSALAVPERSKRRPVSLLIAPGDLSYPPSPTSPNGVYQDPSTRYQRPKPRHTRSHSLPTPVQTPFTSPQQTLAPGTVLSETRDDDRQEAAEEGNPTDKEDDPEILEKNNLSSPATDPADEHEQLGIVAAAVSAVAGALGVGAVTGLHRAKGHGTESPGGKREAISSANESIESTGDGTPQRGAFTGALITSVGDFNSIHVPLERAPTGMESIPQAEAEMSDPEDLALSSADEEPTMTTKDGFTAPKSKPVSKMDSDNGRHSTSAGTSFYHEADEGESITPSATHATPVAISPAHSDQVSRRANREAKIYAQSPITPTFAQNATYVPQPSTVAVQREAGAGMPEQQSFRYAPPGAGTQGYQSLVSPVDEKEIGMDTPSRPGTAGSATLPPRFSSVSNKSGGRLSKTSEYSHHSKSSSSSSKLLGFDREQHNQSQQSSLRGDATVTSLNGVRGTRSGSTNIAREAQTTTQTAVSGSPKSNNRHLRIRTSEDRRAGHSPADSVDEAKKRSLEVLINSDETLHYTLTPASARSESISTTTKPPTQTQDLADFLRNTKPPNEEAERLGNTRAAGSTALNGGRSYTGNMDSSAPNTSKKVVSSPKNGVSPGPSSPKPKSVLGEPRDPRVEPSTMRDLADYARSTGPESAGQLPKPLTAAVPVAAAGIAAAAAYSRSATNAAQHDKPPGTSTSMSSQNTATNLPPRSSSRLKHQARDARPSGRAETSELIDFIREGPPRAPGEHRIDRNVAPFRRTMDSDDLNSLAPQRDQTSSIASTQNSSVATRSMQESTNSQTGLLDSSNRANGMQMNGHRAPSSSTLRQTPAGQEGGMPKRTQRRIRDPYAIDDSDDEVEQQAAKPKSKQEESLIDFLRNTAPPPGMTPKPILSPGSSTAFPSAVRKQPSNSALKDRLLRKTSVTAASREVNSSRQAPPAANEVLPSYNRTTNGARPESPHLSQVGSKLDSYRPTQPTHASHVDKSRQKPKMVMESRDPRTGGDTRELAAYLKSSGPPPTVSVASPPQPISIKEEAGFLKFFSRRRTSVKR